MINVPQDILDFVTEAWPTYPSDPLSIDQVYDAMALAMASAILRERERCADICEAQIRDLGCFSGGDAIDLITLCFEIQTLIRAPEGKQKAPVREMVGESA